MSVVAAILIVSSCIFAAELTIKDYSTYIGDSNEYRVAAIAIDAAGNTYVAGRRIFDSPASVPVSDAFVTKLDSSGTAKFMVTIGGPGSNQANAISLDPAGNIYIAGSTSSRNFPLRNALQTQPGPGFLTGTTGFLVKLSPDGSSLLYSTYFGGTRGASSVNGVAVDAKGDVYLTGFTFAMDFPHTDGLPTGQLSYGGIGDNSAAFISKITAAGDRIVFSGGIVGTALACGGGSSCFL